MTLNTLKIKNSILMKHFDSLFIKIVKTLNERAKTN